MWSLTSQSQFLSEPTPDVNKPIFVAEILKLITFSLHVVCARALLHNVGAEPAPTTLQCIICVYSGPTAPEAIKNISPDAGAVWAVAISVTLGV